MRQGEALTPPGGRHVEWIVSAVLLLAAFVAFSRPIWGSAGDTIPGSDDSLLNMYTMEQWYRWLTHGQGRWLGGGFFFPAENTLGRTDALFLLALPFSALRLAGLDVFTSYQAILYGSSVACAAAFFLLLRRELGLPVLASAIGTIPAAFSNAMFVSVGHTQLFSYVFVPILAILAVRCVRACWNGSPSFAGYAVALAALLSLFFFTGYYLAWFFSFFLLLIAAIALATPSGRSHALRLAASAGWKVPVACVAVFATLLIPFFATYLPILRETGGRPYEHVVHTLPQWFDFINVSYDNFVWRRALQKWFPAIHERAMFWELYKGNGLVTEAAFAIAAVMVWIAWLRRHRAAPAAPVAPWVLSLGAAVAAAAVLSYILLLRVDGQSLWRAVYSAVPGATAIRAVFRFHLLLNFAIGLAIALALALLIARMRASHRWARYALPAVTAFGAMIAAEQVNVGKTDHLSKTKLQGQVALVQAPPAECRSFFVVSKGEVPKPEGDAAYDVRMNVLAMLVGQSLGVPTVNGHSSGAPPRWALAHVSRGDYLVHVAAWSGEHRLAPGICSVDMGTGKWSPFSAADVRRVGPMDSALRDEDFRFEGRLEPLPKSMRAGEQLNATFRFTNLGRRAWTSESQAEKSKFAVNFAYQWVDASGAAPGFNNRWPIIAEARPGEEARVAMIITAPPVPGQYVLEIDAVQEWVEFFRIKGNPTFRTPVVVTKD